MFKHAPTVYRKSFCRVVGALAFLYSSSSAAQPFGDYNPSEKAPDHLAGKALEAFSSGRNGLSSGRLNASVGRLGSFAHQRPIAVPPGRADHTPRLSFEYDSNQANGALGVGWTLQGIPAITRSQFRRGPPKYDGTDTFVVLPGGWGTSPEPRNSLWGIGAHRFTYLDTQVRYTPQGTCGSGPCWWLAVDKSGTSWYYGGDQANNLANNPGSSFVVKDIPNGRTGDRGVLYWGLYKVVDRHGNSWRVSYLDAPRELYPSTISYTHHDQLVTPLREIRFNWESRADGAPVPQLTPRRLASVSVSTNASLIRCYTLEYNSGPSSGRSLLSSVSERTGCSSTSPVVGVEKYDWTDGLTDAGSPFQTAPGGGEYFTSALDWTWPGENHGRYSVHLGDINGDGLDDLVRTRLGIGHRCELNCQTTIVEYALSNGNGFDPVVHHEVDRGPSGLWQDYSSVLVDLDGDSLKDLLLYSTLGAHSFGQTTSPGRVHDFEALVMPGLPKHSPSSPGGLGPSHKVFYFDLPGGTNLPAEAKNWTMLMGDFNGDDRVDLFYVHTINGWYFSAYGAEDQSGEITFTKPTGLFSWAIPAAVSVCQPEQLPDGSMLPPSSASGAFCGTLMDTSVVDQNADGFDDVIITHKAVLHDDGLTSGRLRSLIASGSSGGIVCCTDRYAPEPTRASVQVVGGDFNRDGFPDQAVARFGVQGTTLPSGRNGILPYGKELAFLPGPQDLTHGLHPGIPFTRATEVSSAYDFFWPELRVGAHQVAAGDFNGDGYAEVLSSYRGKMGVEIFLARTTATGEWVLNNGSPVQVALRDSFDWADGYLPGETYETLVSDINGDGNSDVVLGIAGYLGVSVEYMLGSSSSASRFGSSGLQHVLDCPAGGGCPRWGAVGLLEPGWARGDINGDGKTDFVFLARYSDQSTLSYVPPLPQSTLTHFTLSAPEPTDRIRRIIGALGGTVEVAYRPLASFPDAIQPAEPCLVQSGSPLTCSDVRADTRPRWVVATQSQSTTGSTDFTGSGLPLRETTSYSYRNAKRTRGSLTLESRDFPVIEAVTATGQETGSSSETTYQQASDLAGLPFGATTYDSGGRLSSRSYTWYQTSVSQSGLGILVLPSDSHSTSFEGGAAMETITNSTSFDTFGFPKRETVCDAEKCSSTDWRWTHDAVAWKLGRLDSKKTSAKLAGGGTELVLDWRRFTYHPGTLNRDREERLLHHDAAQAICPGPDLENNCSTDVNAGRAQWVLLGRVPLYEFGDVRQFADAYGSLTTYSYDGVYRIHLERVTNPLGHITTVTQDAKSRPVQVDRPDGSSVVLGYDSLGRPSTQSGPFKAGAAFVTTKKLFWSSLGQPGAQNVTTETYTSATDRQTRKEYFDGFLESRRVDTTNHDGRILRASSERFWAPSADGVAGNAPAFAEALPRFCNPSGTTCDPAVWTVVYSDSQGRPSMVWKMGAGQASYQESSTTRRVLQGGDREETTVDAEGRATKTRYRFASARLRSVQDPAGATTYYSYDLAGRITQVSETRLGLVKYSYDSWGRLRRIDHPDFGFRKFAYDQVGLRLDLKEDSLGRSESYDYDSLGRLTVRSINDLSSSEWYQWFYDDPLVPFGVGRLTSTMSSVGRSTRVKKYDPAGGLLEEETTVAWLPTPLQDKYTYDWQGRPVDHTFANGRTESRRYLPQMGPLDQMKFDGTTVATFSAHNALGFPGSRTSGAGTTTTLTFHPDGRPRVVSSQKGASLFQRLEYAYDRTGNVTSRTDTAGYCGHGCVDEDESFVYDNNQRLIQANGASGQITFAYDSVGRFSTFEGLTLSGTGPAVGATYTARNGSAVAWKDTRNGAGERVSLTNVLASATYGYRYDGNGRLVRLEQNGQVRAEYGYDESDRRFTKLTYHADGTRTRSIDVGGMTIRLHSAAVPGAKSEQVEIVSPWGPVATWVGGNPFAGQPTKTNVDLATGALTGSIERGSPYSSPQFWYHHPLPLGSPGTVTNTVGGVASRYVYRPFGRINKTASVGYHTSVLGFAQSQSDAEGELQYLGARYYDPLTGTFLTPDPRLPGSSEDLRFHNLIAYSLNNPQSLVDPTGRVPWDPAGWAIQEGKAATRSIFSTLGGGLNGFSGFPLDPIEGFEVEFAQGQVIGAGYGLRMDAALFYNGLGNIAGGLGGGLVLAPVSGGAVLLPASRAVALGVLEVGVGVVLGNFHMSKIGEAQETLENGRAQQQGAELGRKIPNSELLAPPNRRGNAPIGSDKHPVELHHRGQQPDSPIDEMTRTDHRGKGNFKENHRNTGQEPSKISRPEWKKEQKKYWQKEWDDGRFEGL